MGDYNEIELHPEVKKLLENYNNLKNELARLIEEKEHLIVAVIPKIEAEYKVKVGTMEYDCLLLEVEIRRINREIKIVQAAVSRGETIDESEIEEQLNREFEMWEKPVSDMKNEIREANRFISIPAIPNEQAEEIKILYRNIVKKLYPDVNTGISENEKLLWPRANAAYNNVNIEELRSISILTENIEEDRKLKEEGSIENIINKIDTVKMFISDVLEQINDLNSKFPLNMEQRLSDDKWVYNKNIELSEKIKRLSIKKEFLKSVLSEFK